MHELINTSVPNGLIPGSHGFSTVAMTRGMSDALRTKLEILSGYSHVYSGHDDQYFTQNPESWNHLILATGEHVFSRVAVAPFDYTGRTNRLAHHVVLSAQEIATHNPANILINGLSTILRTPWEGEPRWLEPRNGQEIIAHLPAMGNCDPVLWKDLLGAESEQFIARLATYYANLVTGKGRPICFVRSAQQIGNGARMLALIKELIALLPPNVRHLSTFSTYAPIFPAGVKCDLRVVTENDPHLAQIRQHSFCIDWGHGGVLNSSLLPTADASILNAVKTGCWQYIAPQQQKQVVPETHYEPAPIQQPAHQYSQATNVQRLRQSQYAQQPRRVAPKPYARTQSNSSYTKSVPSQNSSRWWLWGIVTIVTVAMGGLFLFCAPMSSKQKEEMQDNQSPEHEEEAIQPTGNVSPSTTTASSAKGSTPTHPPVQKQAAQQNQDGTTGTNQLTSDPQPPPPSMETGNEHDGAGPKQPVAPTRTTPEPAVNPKGAPRGVGQKDGLAGDNKKENARKINPSEEFKTRLEKCSEFVYCFNLQEVLTLLKTQEFKQELYCYYSEQNDSVGEPLFDFYQIKSSTLKATKKTTFHLEESAGNKINNLSHAYFLCGNKLIVLLEEKENKKFIDLPDDKNQDQVLELLEAFCRHQEVAKKIKDDVFSKYYIEVDIDDTVSFSNEWYKKLTEEEKGIFNEISTGWGADKIKKNLDSLTKKKGIRHKIKYTEVCKPVDVSCFILNKIKTTDSVLKKLFDKVPSQKSGSSNEDDSVQTVETLIGKWLQVYAETLDIKLKLVRRGE